MSLRSFCRGQAEPMSSIDANTCKYYKIRLESASTQGDMGQDMHGITFNGHGIAVIQSPLACIYEWLACEGPSPRFKIGSRYYDFSSSSFFHSLFPSRRKAHG